MTTGCGLAKAEDQITVTVAIPTRNRPENLCAVVGDLWAGVRRPDEILVVCQGDGAVETAHLLRREVPGAASALRFYVSTRRGVSANRNDAIRLATGNFIAFSDDDMRLPASWLETMLKIWVRDWKPGAVLLTGPIQAPDEATDPDATPGQRVGTTRRVWRTPPMSGAVLYGGHFGAPKCAYTRIGCYPFDERFGSGARFPGGEDEAFRRPALRAGVPIVFEPSIQATHMAHARTWIRSQYMHSQGAGALLVFRMSWGDRGSHRAAVRTIFGIMAKAVRAAAGFRFRESVGRLVGVVGILLGAARWWVTGAENEPRASEPDPKELKLVQFD